MSRDKILDKVLSGTSDKNIRFQDLRKVLFRYGFSERIHGDHHIYTRDNRKSKPYQVRQVRNLKYKFHIIEE